MSELALKLIAENKKTKDTFLDLGICGLTNLPDELFELTWLEELNLGEFYRERGQSELKKTNNNQNENQIHEKSRNVVRLANLKNLTSLQLYGNDFVNASFLSDLTGLTNLDISGNKIADISFFSNLNGLTSLDLSYNQITDISFLEGLKSLTRLDLNNNQITDFSFLEELKSLTSLDLNYNQITDYSNLEE